MSAGTADALVREELEIRSDHDVMRVRQAVRTHALSAALSLVDQTKMVTAVSELARNTLTYGGGGTAVIEVVQDGRRKGVRTTFTDHGPGIPDIEKALTDGWTSGDGLGLGLSGSRRLVDVFDLHSVPGEGTTITILKWGR